MVDQRLGAVDVLGFRVVQHAPAERDHVAPQVKDGGDDPPPEQAVDPPGRTALEQAAGVQLGLGVALVPQKVVQGLSIVGRIPQPKPGDGAVVQAAPPPVGPGLGGLVHAGVQAGMEKPGRLLVHGQDAAAHPAGAVVLLGLGHPGPRRQHLDRLGVAQGVDLLDKGDDVPACPAAKAVKALRLGVDVKGRGLFVVERAQASIQPALAFELDVTAHHVHDVAAADQLLNVFVWYHSGKLPCIIVFPRRRAAARLTGRATAGAHSILQRRGWQTRRSSH